ncbi:MAG TPA: MobV family relaxase [Pyrinomonadaceae bacterium]
MAFAIARLAKQKGGSVGSSSLHNGRGRETPNADPEREKDNRVLIGDERPVPERVREVIREHGGKPRSDSVEAVEILLTASPEWWQDDHGETDRKKVDQFSAAAREFLSKRENGGICVKATLHMDERTPHIHAHNVPIDPAGRLNCKHYFGDRKKLSKWQDRFADHVRDLGLERGVRDSRARHTDIKDFYKAIEREHRIRVDYEKLPDPPRMCVTKDAARKFKEEFAKALVEQIQQPIRTQLHQAMLARDTQAKLKETKSRLAQARERLSQEQLKVMDLKEENERVRQQNSELANRTQKAEARVEDIDYKVVLKMLGYRGVPGQKRGTVDFLKQEHNLMVTVYPGGVYDAQGKVVARNSVELVQEMMKREGRPSGRAEAVGWLADHCGKDRAKAASLVEHEQATEGYLHERKVERDRTVRTPVRDETLARPELERVRDRGMERDGHDHDFGLSR